MRRALSSVLIALTLLAATPLPQAQAAPKLTISSSEGGTRASTTGPTTFQVKGSGFQSLPNAFGGIYMMFGWVSDPSGGSWKPSNGGRTGTDLLYVPDSESKNNQGYQKFIAFPGSSTKDSANGGEIASNGTISLNLVVPGPRFTAQDREGNAKDVDCLKVQCGIITIGAHGVVNAKNESFTPISFAGASTGTKTATQSGTGTDQQGAGQQSTTTTSNSSTAPKATASANAAAAVPATVGLSQGTIQAGRVLGFTGQGFDAGEQVVATVGAGLAGVGPLTAGRFGEVAGAITLPSDMRAGTHTVTLTAAGSGKSAEATLSVLADAASMGAANADVEQVSDLWRWATISVAIVAALLLVLVISSLITAIVKRRGARTQGKVRVRRAAPTTGQRS